VPFVRGVLRDTRAALELANEAIKEAERWLEDRGNANADGVR
jgi:hypothetical protein